MGWGFPHLGPSCLVEALPGAPQPHPFPIPGLRPWTPGPTVPFGWDSHPRSALRASSSIAGRAKNFAEAVRKVHPGRAENLTEAG